MPAGLETFLTQNLELLIKKCVHNKTFLIHEKLNLQKLFPFPGNFDRNNILTLRNAHFQHLSQLLFFEENHYFLNHFFKIFSGTVFTHNLSQKFCDVYLNCWTYYPQWLNFGIFQVTLVGPIVKSKDQVWKISAKLDNFWSFQRAPKFLVSFWG